MAAYSVTLLYRVEQRSTNYGGFFFPSQRLLCEVISLRHDIVTNDNWLLFRQLTLSCVVMHTTSLFRWTLHYRAAALYEPSQQLF